MNNWSTAALAAYLIGAAIEGVSTASGLSHSVPQLSEPAEGSESADPPLEKWQVILVVATVTLCGAFSWPCRLIHRSIKGERPHTDN